MGNVKLYSDVQAGKDFSVGQNKLCILLPSGCRGRFCVVLPPCQPGFLCQGRPKTGGCRALQREFHNRTPYTQVHQLLTRPSSGCLPTLTVMGAELRPE